LLRKEFESKLAVLMENFKDQLEQSAP
jgi:hypothetical protein